MRLPSFDRMVDAFAEEATGERGAGRVRFGRRRAVAGAIAAGLVVTGGTLAATGALPVGEPAEVKDVEIPVGTPIPPEVRRQDAPVDQATVRLREARAPDPDGGPPWGLRTFRTTRGDDCVQVGRVVQGKLGVVGFDGKFHEVPALTRISRCAIPVRPGMGFPPGAELLWEGPLPPVSTRILDEYGFSRVTGCDELPRGRRGPAGDRPIRPCDRNRFRFVAAGVLDRDVRSLDIKRVPASEPPRRTPPAADRSFVYVLRGGDPAGARIAGVTGSGAELLLVRVGRGFAVPTGHPNRRAMRAARPEVAPAEGPADATFALRFRMPAVSEQRRDGLSYRISGPGGPSCTVHLATVFGEPIGDRVRPRPPVFAPGPSGMGRLRHPEAIRRGQLVTRRIEPPGPPPYRWCPGDYRGEIRLNDKRIVGTFGFRVRR